MARRRGVASRATGVGAISGGRGSGVCRALRALPRAGRRAHSAPLGTAAIARRAHCARARCGRHACDRDDDEPRRAARGRRISRHRRRGHGSVRRSVLRRSHRHAKPVAARRLERLEPDGRQRAVSAGRARRSARRGSTEPAARMGIRFRRRRHGVRGADDRGRPRLRRERRRARASARRRQRLPEVDVPSDRTRARGADRCDARRRPGAARRRPHGLALRARCRDGRAHLEDANRNARLDAAYGRRCRARRRRVRARVVVGGVASRRSGLRVLHVPRQRRRRARARRHAAVEEVPNGSAVRARQERSRLAAVRAFGRGCLVDADRRRGARAALRHDGRQLHGARDADERCRRCARAGHGAHRMAQANDAQRRLQRLVHA